MASNQGHHVGSLPNDYAILARFAHDDRENEHNHTEEEDGEVDRVRVQSPRRSSFPSSYIRPPPPAIPSMDFKSDRHLVVGNSPTENTPLLGPLVPRIQEEPGDEDHNDTKSNMTMFWGDAYSLKIHFASLRVRVILRNYHHLLHTYVCGIERIYWNTVW